MTKSPIEWWIVSRLINMLKNTIAKGTLIMIKDFIWKSHHVLNNQKLYDAYKWQHVDNYCRETYTPNDGYKNRYM